MPVAGPLQFERNAIRIEDPHSLALRNPADSRQSQPKLGCERAMLVQRAADVDWQDLEGIKVLGITAGASAPEVLVEEVIAACRERFEVSIEEVTVTSEDVVFKLPRLLTANAAA